MMIISKNTIAELMENHLNRRAFNLTLKSIKTKFISYVKYFNT